MTIVYIIPEYIEGLGDCTKLLTSTGEVKIIEKNIDTVMKRIMRDRLISQKDLYKKTYEITNLKRNFPLYLTNLEMLLPLKCREIKMKGDRAYGYINENGEIKYFVKVGNEWIEVPKEVFLVIQNSYRKMLRDNNKDRMLIHFDQLEQAQRYVHTDMTNEQSYTTNDLMFAFGKLTDIEKRIIYKLYFENISEKTIAFELGVSESTLNYRKKKILNKMKKFLVNQ